jgi:hypothetical protein
MTPADRIREGIGFAGKLVLQNVLEFRRAGNFLKALPILASGGRLQFGPNLSEIDRL